MSRVEIIPLSFRDCCFVAANIRKEDWDECRCQMDEENKFLLANACYFTTEEDRRWCGTLDGQPVLAVGLTKSSPSLYQGWMFGTKRVKRCIPELQMFLDIEVRRLMIEKGARRIEIRALQSHSFVTSGWLRALGAEDCGALPQYGKNGENFQLFAWWKGMKNGQDICSSHNRVRDPSINSFMVDKPSVGEYGGGTGGFGSNGRRVLLGNDRIAVLQRHRSETY